jgi:hypothetical protein
MRRILIEIRGADQAFLEQAAARTRGNIRGLAEHWLHLKIEELRSQADDAEPDAVIAQAS